MDMRNLDKGWIKVYRSLLYDGTLKNHGLSAFWYYCLLRANYQEGYRQLVGFQEVTLQPGQFIFGRKKAAEDLNTTESKIRTFIKALKKRGSITIESTNAYSIITVVNWAPYQLPDKDLDQQVHQPIAGTSPADNHKQESKKERMNNNKENMCEANEKETPLENDIPVKEILEQHLEQELNPKTKKAIHSVIKGLKQHKHRPQQIESNQEKEQHTEITSNNVKVTIDQHLERIYPNKDKHMISDNKEEAYHAHRRSEERDH